jgi:S-phase kinase-associated protein 1
MIDLVSQEGDNFQVDVNVAKMSELVKTMIPEDDDESEAQEIPLPNVKSQILGKVIEFCKHYVSDPMNEIEKPLKSANMSEVVQEWYANYVDVEQEVLFELILAANYMDIKPLLDLTCATVASMIKGKTPEEIRKTFNIVNDFTPEEEAQVRSHKGERRILMVTFFHIFSASMMHRFGRRTSGAKRHRAETLEDFESSGFYESIDRAYGSGSRGLEIDQNIRRVRLDHRSW